MVVDTSALIAILGKEAGSDRLVAALEGADRRRASAATIVESAIVAQARWGDSGEAELDQLLLRASIVVAPVEDTHVELARSAYRLFGKGRHPAGLNFGDCFAYALAQELGEPLLFVGEDFSKTDVVPVELP